MFNQLTKPILLLFLAAALATGMLAASPAPAYACSCMMPGPPEQEMANASAVFSGRVASTSAPGGAVISSADPVAVLFDVSRVWKGPLESRISLTTARDSASCGIEFRQGEEYLVYSYQGERGLETNLCTRTALVASAGEDLAALGEGQVPPPAAPETQSPLPWILVGGAVLLGLALLAVALLSPRRKTG